MNTATPAASAATAPSGAQTEVFIRAANYSDKRREGIGVTANVYRGEQRVTVGKGWVKTHDGETPLAAPQNLFVSGAISLTPDDAEKLADEIRAAAVRARALTIPPAEEKAAKPVRGAKALAAELGNQLLAALSGDATALQGIQAAIQGRLNPPATSTAAPAVSAPAPAPAPVPVPVTVPSPTATVYRKFESEANQTRFDEHVLTSKTKLEFFDQLIEGKVDPVQALNMVISSKV